MREHIRVINPLRERKNRVETREEGTRCPSPPSVYPRSSARSGDKEEESRQQKRKEIKRRGDPTRRDVPNSNDLLWSPIFRLACQKKGAHERGSPESLKVLFHDKGKRSWGGKKSRA